jgi:hypothetical protein
MSGGERKGLGGVWCCVHVEEGRGAVGVRSVKEGGPAPARVRTRRPVDQRVTREQGKNEGGPVGVGRG